MPNAMDFGSLSKSHMKRKVGHVQYNAKLTAAIIRESRPIEQSDKARSIFLTPPPLLHRASD